VYVDKVYAAASHVKIPVSNADPFWVVIVKVKSVGQLAVFSVEVTAESKNLCTFGTASMT